MDELKLGVVESRFADLIWKNEPLHSRELVQLCQQIILGMFLLFAGFLGNIPIKFHGEHFVHAV